MKTNMTNSILKALLANQEEIIKTLMITVVRDSVYGTLIAFDADDESIEIWNGSPDNRMQTNRMHESDTTLHQLACVQFETPEEDEDDEDAFDRANRRDFAEGAIQTIIEDQLFEWSKSLWPYFSLDAEDFQGLIQKIDEKIERLDDHEEVDMKTELESFKFDLENPELSDEFRDSEPYELEEQCDNYEPTPGVKAQSKIYQLNKGFDTIEVHTVGNIGDGVEILEDGIEIPEDMVFGVSIYGHTQGEGLTCIGDFDNFEEACECAEKLGGLEKEPRFNDYTKSEFIEFLEETLIPDLKDSGYESIPTDFETAVSFLKL